MKLIIILSITATVWLHLKELTKSVDVVVTSPPYNINLSYNSYDDNKNRIRISQLDGKDF